MLERKKANHRRSSSWTARTEVVDTRDRRSVTTDLGDQEPDELKDLLEAKKLHSRNKSADDVGDEVIRSLPRRLSLARPRRNLVEPQRRTGIFLPRSRIEMS